MRKDITWNTQINGCREINVRKMLKEKSDFRSRASKKFIHLCLITEHNRFTLTFGRKFSGGCFKKTCSCQLPATQTVPRIPHKIAVSQSKSFILFNVKSSLKRAVSVAQLNDKECKPRPVSTERKGLKLRSE